MASSKPDLGAFARNLVVKAFDTLASKAAELSGDTKAGLQKLADSWRDLTDAEREELASRVTATAATLPIAFAARKRVRKRVKKTAVAAAQGATETVKAKTKKKNKKAKKDKKKKKKDKKKKKK